MKFSTAFVSAIAFAGFSQAQAAGTAGNSSSSSSRSSNAAVALHGANNAASYGLSGAVIAGALAYLF
ncbi:hypothetical protein MOSE0_L10352 [Monosporozyma servazzii]